MIDGVDDGPECGKDSGVELAFIGVYRVRALNARIQSMRRTALIGTRNNEAAQPRTIAITV